jgi:hypothetical protein
MSGTYRPGAMVFNGVFAPHRCPYTVNHSERFPHLSIEDALDVRLRLCGEIFFKGASRYNNRDKMMAKKNGLYHEGQTAVFVSSLPTIL